MDNLVRLEPKETKPLEVLFHSQLATVKENSAILIGQLSPAPENQNETGIFSRTGGTFGPTFRIDLSAIIQGTLLQLFIIVSKYSVVNFVRISVFW